MTQTEAVIEALRLLGGKSQLKWITLLALNMKGVDWTGGQTPDANIRRIVRQTPLHIEPLGEGCYQLVGYQSELEKCQAIIKEKDEEIKRLRGIESAGQFVERFIQTIKQLLKRNTQVVEELRKIFVHLGLNDEAAELDRWIEKNDPSNNKFTFESGSQNTIIATPNKE